MNFDPSKDNEAAFDAEVAPILRDLGDACVRLGLPLLVAIQFAPGSIARTVILPVGSLDVLVSGAAAMFPDVDVDVEGETDQGGDPN